ncbi:putative sporulation protein YtxC [Falsibacillus pallidus]|uniref:putative sporulation protein YtxC n=1 Tax=Falsibacillus pallidus TaxID=493781 RepID=UPI003D984706
MEFIFKQWQDVMKFQQCLAEHAKSSWYHETLFQNEKHFILMTHIDELDYEQAKHIMKEFLLFQKRADWARGILEDQFFYSEEEEQAEILAIVHEMLNGEREELTSLLEPMDDAGVLEEALASIFDQSEAISFDSFIRFRLKKYMERMVQYVELAIDEYKMEQEYQSFTNMLREYLGKKDPKINMIHLLFKQEPIFYTERFEMMNRQEIMAMLDKRLLTNHPVYIDSYTLAPLLSMAPNTIFIYTDHKDHGLIRTIQKIFEERICILSEREFWEEKKSFEENASAQ